MSKSPVAILISDIHFNINTLEVADKAMRLAIDKANSLSVPLIVCGDLHDTKAHLRGECVTALIKTFETAKIRPYVLVGNHDKINEKSNEHSLSFLERYATIVNRFRHTKSHALMHDWTLVAYHHDVEQLRGHLKHMAPYKKLIMHQGIQGSNSGEYFQDKSALRPEDVAGFRVISGHYHTRQTIALPDGGQWDFVGNPFTLGYGEANDPPKGFQVLYNDGSLEFVPTNLREHRIMDYSIKELKGEGLFLGEPEDIVWVKIRGPKEALDKLTKKQIAVDLDISQDFKLELIPDEQTSDKTVEPVSQTKEEVLDGLIDSLTNTTVIQKQRLKSMWKDFV